MIIDKCQINRLWNRLNLFLKEFEDVQSENSGNISNSCFKEVKRLFLQIESHIKSYKKYGPFKKLISNNELEKTFDNYNSQLVYYSLQLGLRNLPYLNNSVRDMEDQDDKEEDNEHFNSTLNSAMATDDLLLSFLGCVTDREMIIEAISTLEDIINEGIIKSDIQSYQPLPNGDDGDRKLVYIQSNSKEIISITRNYKKPIMNRKKYANIDNIVYVCEYLKKKAEGLSIESKNWQIASWDIEIWEKLSVGPFSKIYKGFWLGNDVAVKEMSYQINRVRIRKEFYKDVKMWFNLSHPNVLSLYGANILGDYPLVVIPLMKNGNLIDYIEGKERLSLLKLIEILIGVSSGMEYLHAKNVVHGDLMARNILLDEHLQPHICDFGFSKCRADVDHHSKLKRLDSLRWTANEVHESFIYTKKSDVYSFAMLCYELFTWGAVPFQNLSERFLSEAVIAGKRPEYPEGCPMAIWRLMEQMWNGNPEARPDFSDITRYLYHFKTELKRQALQDKDSISEGRVPSNEELNEPHYPVYMEDNTASPALSNDYIDNNSSNPSVDSPLYLNNNNPNVDSSPLYLSNNDHPSVDSSSYLNNSHPTVDTTSYFNTNHPNVDYPNSGSDNYSPRVYQFSPGRSPHLISGMEDVSGSGSGTGSIELNSSVSQNMSHSSKYPSMHNDATLLKSNVTSPSKSIAIPYIKNPQGRPVVIGSHKAQGSGRSYSHSHSHSLSGSFSYNGHSVYPHSPSNSSSNIVMSIPVGMHPVQFTSEMLPERLSSMQIHSSSVKNGKVKPINVVQSNYRQRNNSSSSATTVGPSSSSLTTSQASPNILSPRGGVGSSNDNGNGNDNGNNNGNSNGNLKSSNSIYRLSNGGNSITNLKRVTSTNHHYHHNPEEDEIDSSMVFTPTRNGYLSQSAYDFAFKELEEEMYPQKMYLTRTKGEEIDQENWNEFSLSDEDDYAGHYIENYFDDDYVDIYSQPNFNEINDSYRHRIQKIFENDIELSSIYENENDELYQYRYMVDDNMLKGMTSNSSGNNYASYGTTSSYNKRRSSQGLTIDTTRKSRSYSRSHATANPLSSGNGNDNGHGISDHRSRSRSHSRSRTRSKSNNSFSKPKYSFMDMESFDGTPGMSAATPTSMNTPLSQRKLSIGPRLSFSDNKTHDNDNDNNNNDNDNSNVNNNGNGNVLYQDHRRNQSQGQNQNHGVDHRRSQSQGQNQNHGVDHRRSQSQGQSQNQNQGVDHRRSQSQGQSQNQNQGVDHRRSQGQYYKSQESQPYQTPPASRPHSPYIYGDDIDDDMKGEDSTENYSKGKANLSIDTSNLLHSMINSMSLHEEGVKEDQDNSGNSYSVPCISDRTEGVYRCDIRKDITFSFMDDDDLSVYYPKEEYCLSKLTFPGINPEAIQPPTFKTDFIQQICMEVPTEPIEKKDFAREMLLNIYMNEFKVRFGEFKFEEVIKKNRIEFNTYGFSDWSYKRSAYKVLIDIIKYTHIKHLFIRNCRFGDPAIVALANALIFNDEFTIIDITFCSKRSRPPQENNIMDIIRYDASNLDPKWVLNTNVTAKSGQLFANLVQQSKNLKAIHLRNAAFGDDCAIMMANALQHNKNIEDFELTNCEVHESGAVAFAEALKTNKILLRLILQQNPIEDKGAIAISSALRKNKTLKYLLLQKCGLTSKSMSSFTLTFLNNLGLELIK